MHKVVTVEHGTAAEAATETERAINELTSQGWEFAFATSAYLRRRDPLDPKDWDSEDSVAHTLFFRQPNR